MNKETEIKIKNKKNAELFTDSFNNDNMVLLVWADWCYYSKIYIPEWNKFKKSLTKKDLNKFKIFELKDNYKNKLNDNPVFLKVFESLRGFPTTFVIDKNGKITILPGNDIDTLKKLVKKFK